MKVNKIRFMATLLFTCALGTTQAQETEKSFIQENMEFAAKQYQLMLKTPAQGKRGKVSCLTACARMAQFLKAASIYGRPDFSRVVYGIFPTSLVTKPCKTPHGSIPNIWSLARLSPTTMTSAL